mgnify:FL=1
MKTDLQRIDRITEMRVLCLEKEIEKLQECILQLEVKLKANPYTRDTFRDNQFYGFQAIWMIMGALLIVLITGYLLYKIFTRPVKSMKLILAGAFFLLIGIVAWLGLLYLLMQL